MKRWLKRALWFFGAIFLCFAVFLLWVRYGCEAEPPTLAYDPVIKTYTPTELPDERGRTYYGPNWFQEAPGHSLLYVEGDPYSIGHANAYLTRRFLAAQED